MDASATLAKLTGAGLTLELADGKIRAKPAGKLTDELRDLIRTHKPELLALLSERHRQWQITEADGTHWTSSFCPPQALAEVQARYPGARSVEPYLSPAQAAGGALSARHTALVASALDAMGEDCPDTRREIMERCAADPEALAFWLARAPDARPALYREWLAGIEEPRALVTLSDTQIRQAVAAGVVTRDTARASVLILAKAPRGESGPGAGGLLAIPREKYADFGPVAALEALQWTH